MLDNLTWFKEVNIKDKGYNSVQKPPPFNMFKKINGIKTVTIITSAQN